MGGEWSGHVKGTGVGRPSTSKKGTKIVIPPGENAEALRHAMAGFNQERVDTRDPDAVEKRLGMYLQYCLENDLKPMVNGAALWLGIRVEQMEDWLQGKYGVPGLRAVISKFYGVIQTLWDDWMLNGKINPVAGIFISKVYFGYKESHEIIMIPQTEEQISVQDLIAEADRLPSTDDRYIEVGADELRPCDPIIDVKGYEKEKVEVKIDG